MKGVATTLIIGIIVVMAIAAILLVPALQQKQQSTFQQPSTQQSQPFTQQGGVKCPDGVCDEFEKSAGVCPEDCGGTRQQPSPGTTQPQGQTQESPISIANVGGKYKIVSAKPSGWFTTGQDADILLSGVDFNNAGGPLLFNHPGNVATDGTHLILADRFNNRILIWNKLPTGNTTPDLVLGQKDFYSNNPGKGLDQMNWPVSVAIAGNKLVVADTYNDRILIWNSFPTKNGQPADLAINDDRNNPKRNIGWPWAVWTNGEKFIVTSTSGAKVLIWNKFPTQNDESADIVLYAQNNFGTPRSIGSDGKHLIIGDHNSKVSGGRGNFFWKNFPTTDNQPYDFYVADVSRMSEPVKPPNVMGDILWGATFTPEGKLIGVANMLYIWNSFPENENDGPDLAVGAPNRESKVGYDFGGSQSGDGSGIAMAGNKVYISLYNGNKIVGFNSFPTKSDQKPDFAVGAPDINTNTLKTNYFATNAIPLTDGKSLFVLSNYDSTLYVWKSLPDESGTKPDFVYTFASSPNTPAIVRNKFVLVAGTKLLVWKALPLNGEKPDVTFDGKISNIDITKINGIAGDDKYFYISTQENKTYVWEDVPTQETNPKFTINIGIPGIKSDGTYITSVSTFEHLVKIYRVVDLLSNPQNPPQPMTVGGRGVFNLPQGAVIKQNHLFVADTVFSRVLGWKNVEDATAGKDADVVLGAENLTETTPEIGKDKLFWPSGIDFDGSYLWIGEFKFSNRVLRFSVQ